MRHPTGPLGYYSPPPPTAVVSCWRCFESRAKAGPCETCGGSGLVTVRVVSWTTREAHEA